MLCQPFIKTDVAKMIIGQRKDKQENWHDKTEYVCHCTCIDIRFFWGEVRADFYDKKGKQNCDEND